MSESGKGSKGLSPSSRRSAVKNALRELAGKPPLPSFKDALSSPPEKEILKVGLRDEHANTEPADQQNAPSKADEANKFFEFSDKYVKYGLLDEKVTILADFIKSAYDVSDDAAVQIAASEKIRLDEIISRLQAGHSDVLGQPAHAKADVPALTLPDAPPKYAYKPRMEGGIVKYLEDNWATYIEAGVLTRPDLRRIDPAAYKALENWLSTPGKELPHHLQVPKKTEALDREIALLGGEDRIRRLASALVSRERRRAPP